MKKSLLIAMLFGTLVFVVPSAEAKSPAAAPAAAGPQIHVQVGRNRNRSRSRYRRTWVTTSTRVTGFGRNRYRETIRVTHYANGRTTSRVISRTRVRW